MVGKYDNGNGALLVTRECRWFCAPSSPWLKYNRKQKSVDFKNRSPLNRRTRRPLYKAQKGSHENSTHLNSNCLFPLL